MMMYYQLFYDPNKNVIANVHSGWRGTFQKIAQKTVRKMKEEYNSNPEDIIACICPAIRVCHFEVDTDVKEECERIFKYTNRLDEIIKLGRVFEEKQKYNIDTILINKILLKEEGLKEENILDSGICSVCSSEKVHSRRVEGANFGVGSAVIALDFQNIVDFRSNTGSSDNFINKKKRFAFRFFLFFVYFLHQCFLKYL